MLRLPIHLRTWNMGRKSPNGSLSKTFQSEGDPFENRNDGRTFDKAEVSYLLEHYGGANMQFDIANNTLGMTYDANEMIHGPQSGSEVWKNIMRHVKTTGVK